MKKTELLARIEHLEDELNKALVWASQIEEEIASLQKTRREQSTNPINSPYDNRTFNELMEANRQNVAHQVNQSILNPFASYSSKDS